MKKLFLGAAIAMSSLTFAQTYGVKAGMNVASISEGDGLEQSSKIGLNAGVFANFPIAASFSIQPELMYNQLGAKTDYSNTTLGVTNTYTSTQSLDYITLPVMFQYNLTPAFYMEAGPEFGLLMAAKEKGDATATSGTTVVSTTFDRDNKDTFNSFNAGIGIGAGYYFTPNIGLTARYTAGLTKLGKDEANSGNIYDESKNNVFQVGLAYKF
ncbi:MAG: PorT family protein [Kaistella sp.]|nr:PorT family protein [Kaistella sp.]